MKKYLVLFVACLVVLTSCKDKKAEQASNQLKQRNDSLISALNQRNGELDDVMGTINQVQEGFRQINAAEGRMDLQQGSAENSQSARQKLAQDIEFIKSTMQANKEKIASLREKMKNGKNDTAQLKELIESLQKQLEQQQQESAQKIKTLQDELASKNVHIAELDKTVSDLNTNVGSLTQENSAKSRTMAQQDKDLNKAWYVFGTKKELKDQRILKSGQVLKNSDYNKNYFTEVDIRTQKEIKLYSKKASLLTNHPAGSYTLDKDEKKELILKITNPTEFWSVSKYLVIMVK